MSEETERLYREEVTEARRHRQALEKILADTAVASNRQAAAWERIATALERIAGGGIVNNDVVLHGPRGTEIVRPGPDGQLFAGKDGPREF